ncbi:MAG: hypothetical protein L0387_42380 [Acidobacteria bacterium]|nr:hypothetical protein [Acidobacteriota bacterium]
MRRLILWVLSAALAMSANAILASAQVSERTVTVGAWNLEWLGTPAKRSNNLGPRRAEDLRAIATTIADVLDLEVVVLVEINTQHAEWTTLRGELAPRGFQFIEGSGGAQRVVIAFDADEVQATPSTEPAEPAGFPTSFTRPDSDGSGQCLTSNAPKPLFANLRAGQFDFTVVGVHLKSKLSPQDCSDQTFTAFAREEQANAILAEIARRQQIGQADQDVLVLGDYNDEVHESAPNALRAGGFRLLTEDANRSPSSGNLSYLKAPFRSKIDHIAMRPVERGSHSRSETMYLPAITTMTQAELDTFHRRFSDHGPAWTEFGISQPDDD